MSIEDTKRKRFAAQHLAESAEGKPGVARQRPVVGAFAQVSLLPREMLLRDRHRTIRRRLIAGVVVTGAVVAAAVMGAGALAVGAGAELASQTANQGALAQQMLKYASVQQLEGRLALDRAAARVGSSTAIDWDPQIDRVTRPRPAGFTISAIATDAATPIQDYSQGDTSLDQPRAASIIITAKSQSITGLPRWIAAVTALPEVADATPSVSTTDSGSYTVVLTVHLNDKSYITPLKSGAAK